MESAASGSQFTATVLEPKNTTLRNKGSIQRWRCEICAFLLIAHHYLAPLYKEQENQMSFRVNVCLMDNQPIAQ